jgi:hypothetical protein
MKQILGKHLSFEEVESYEQTIIQSKKSDTNHEPRLCMTPTHATPTIDSSELTQENFTQLWKLYTPIVVSGVFPSDRSRWTPQYISENYGYETCPIENCQNGEQKISTVREFFDMYGKGISDPWKLKVTLM